MKLSTLKKIAALAERGEGGEKANALAILHRHRNQQFTFYSAEPASMQVMYFSEKSCTQKPVFIPFHSVILDKENNTDLWHEVSAIAISVIKQEYGLDYMQNDSQYITVLCSDNAQLQSVQNSVNALVTNYLLSKGKELPVAVSNAIQFSQA